MHDYEYAQRDEIATTWHRAPAAARSASRVAAAALEAALRSGWRQLRTATMAGRVLRVLAGLGFAALGRELRVGGLA